MSDPIRALAKSLLAAAPRKTGRPSIPDGLPDTISRQRRYQLRKRAKGCCSLCGKPRVHYAMYCDVCGVKQRRLMRKRAGYKPWTPKSKGRAPFVPDKLG